MFSEKKRRLRPEINAGSMADIAFLLLIFFLVTTQIIQEQGIFVVLPPWDEDTTVIPKPDRNVLNILVNSENKLLVEKEPATIKNLKSTIKEFVLNPKKSKELADSPQHAVVSLLNDRSTSYETYIEVYNEIQAAYNEMREDYANKAYGKSYEDLNKKLKLVVFNAIPTVISEAEPMDLGASIVGVP